MLDSVRTKLGAALFEKVAGAEGPQRRNRVHDSAGPRWFEPDRPIRQVHGDASMFVGGLRALLLQSLHPPGHGRCGRTFGLPRRSLGGLARTSYFLAATTFGTAADAQAMVDRIRAIHDKVSGTAPDGRPYAASDPHLLRWVHLAEVDSFLGAHQRYGARPLDEAGCDGYVADTARVAAALGVRNPPTTLARADGPASPNTGRSCRGTPAARDAARFILLQPPLPLAGRLPYALLAAAAVGSLPRWARWPLRLPYLPLAEATVVRVAGEGLVRGIRWAMTPPPAEAA